MVRSGSFFLLIGYGVYRLSKTGNLMLFGDPFSKAKLKEDHEFDKGSKIQTVRITPQQVQNLKTLCKIWGFLKYHHPALASGDINWDYELFRIMPKVLQSETVNDTLYVNWINKLGNIETVIQNTPTKTISKPELDLITNSRYSSELTQILLKVKDAKRPAKNYYVSKTPGVGNPDFSREEKYAAMPYPDAGYRLLALFRYWNAIEYFYPYKQGMLNSWDAVLETFIPKILETKNQTEYTLCLLELIGKIQDTHATLSDNETVASFFGKKSGSTANFLG